MGGAVMDRQIREAVTGAIVWRRSRKNRLGSLDYGSDLAYLILLESFSNYSGQFVQR
jgi:hypothetical protein